MERACVNNSWLHTDTLTGEGIGPSEYGISADVDGRVKLKKALLPLSFVHVLFGNGATELHEHALPRLILRARCAGPEKTSATRISGMG